MGRFQIQSKSKQSEPVRSSSPPSKETSSAHQLIEKFHRHHNSMVAFHPFPRLPFELRARIWGLTVELRTVEVRTKKEHESWGKILHVTPSTPVPAVLQACHEARNLRLYQQAFTLGVEPRYVCVNFHIDMISIGDTYFDTIEPAEQLLIRRLTFEHKDSDSLFYFQYRELQRFSNLEEIHVICIDGVLAGHDAWEYVPWPCPKENLRFIDKGTGQIAVGEDLDRMADEWLASIPLAEDTDE